MNGDPYIDEKIAYMLWYEESYRKLKEVIDPSLLRKHSYRELEQRHLEHLRELYMQINFSFYMMAVSGTPFRVAIRQSKMNYM